MKMTEAQFEMLVELIDSRIAKAMEKDPYGDVHNRAADIYGTASTMFCEDESDDTEGAKDD
jgi:hypothetical protein